jgi:hypothetical protein
VGWEGATVSFVFVAVLAADALPAASVAVAATVIVPSEKAEAFRPLTTTEPAPFVAATVPETGPEPEPLSVTVTRSLPPEPAASVTVTERLDLLAMLT